MDQANRVGGCKGGYGGFRCWSWDCERCGPLKDGDNRRKLRDNFFHYGGSIRVVTLTGPGDDVLPRCPDGRVDDMDAHVFNLTASRRARRLFQAASKAADRYIRLMGYKGDLPRSLGVVWALQKRGVWHVHWALPNETPAEKLWSKTVVRFMDKTWRTEAARYSAQERKFLLALEAGEGLGMGGEYARYKPPKSFYGWGFVDRKDAAHGNNHRAAGYLGLNAAGYFGKNVASGVGAVGRTTRLYVSSRLTKETGVTIRNLRRLRHLYVRRALGETPLIPEKWNQNEGAKLLKLLGPETPSLGNSP